MARPTKWRRIENIPSVINFVPSETGAEGYPVNILKLEELEAIRLKDLEGLEQGECAERMQVSRPTFQRILLSAREKIADGLINAKTLHIEGGNFTRNICSVSCRQCGRKWTESYENLRAAGAGKYTCPSCGSVSVICGQDMEGKFCGRHCRSRGRSED